MGGNLLDLKDHNIKQLSDLYPRIRISGIPKEKSLEMFSKSLAHQNQLMFAVVIIVVVSTTILINAIKTFKSVQGVQQNIRYKTVSPIFLSVLTVVC